MARRPFDRVRIATRRAVADLASSGERRRAPHLLHGEAGEFWSPDFDRRASRLVYVANADDTNVLSHPLERGLLYVARDPTRVRLYDFDTEETMEILRAPVRLPSDTPILAATVDARRLFLTQLDRQENDIMMVDF